MRRDSGFTLIEVIVSLVLVGLIALVAGMGIVSFAKGYVFTRDSTHMAQKAQLAMARLNREFMELLDITDASDPTKISFESTTGDREIGLDDGKIKIAESGTPLTNGDALIDNVNNFTLSYYTDYLAGQQWVFGTDDMDLLTAIQFDFTLIGVGGTFSTIVYPRNK